MSQLLNYPNFGDLAMKIVLAMLLFFLPAPCFSQATGKADPPAAQGKKARTKPAKQKYVIDFAKVRKQYIAAVRRGDIGLPNPDTLPRETRFRRVEAEAVRSWVYNSNVDDGGLMPKFYIHILQIVDEKNATADGSGDNILWISGFDTKQWKEGEEVEIPSAYVKIGTHRFSSTTGAAKTVRSLEMEKPFDSEQATESRSR